jgi:excisionase family DNA binding protein
MSNSGTAIGGPAEHQQCCAAPARVVGETRTPMPAVLDLPEAAKLLGLGRTTAYRLVRDQQWPTPVLRLGRLIKIPTGPLLDLLAGGAAQHLGVDSDSDSGGGRLAGLRMLPRP